VSATHYWNLDSTLSKLERLFQDFTFGSYRDVFESKLEALSA